MVSVRSASFTCLLVPVRRLPRSSRRSSARSRLRSTVRHHATPLEPASLPTRRMCRSSPRRSGQEHASSFTHNVRHFRSGEGVPVVRPRTLIEGGPRVDERVRDVRPLRESHYGSTCHSRIKDRDNPRVIDAPRRVPRDGQAPRRRRRAARIRGARVPGLPHARCAGARLRASTMCAWTTTRSPI